MTAEKRIGVAISAGSSGEAVAMIERAEELGRVSAAWLTTGGARPTG